MSAAPELTLFAFARERDRERIVAQMDHERAGVSRRDADRFVARILIVESGCWFLACRDGTAPRADRYSEFRAGQTRHLGHRLSFSLFVRAFCGDETVCHHCDTPACIHPEHVFSGTQSENIRDAVSKGRMHRQAHPQTHCKRGHEFTTENTIRLGTGGRNCRVCTRDLNRVRAEHYRDNQIRRDEDVARDIERLVPIARELASKAGIHGVTIADVRLTAQTRGILTGEENAKRLAFLGVVMREAGLAATKQTRRSPIPKSHRNRHTVWVLPTLGEIAHG